jgi:uncharacterized protein YcfJ
MKYPRKTLYAATALLLCTQAFAQVTFYEGEDYRGRAFTTTQEQRDFRNGGFNDRASSVVVDGGRWEVCEDAGYRGRCVMLRPGAYDSLKQLGVNNAVSSARLVRASVTHDTYYSPEPLPTADYEYRRRANERVHEARVTSVRAVMGRDDQRCWMERERVERNGDRIAGGVVGGVIGGILGHQIGSGSGQDIATAGGAVAGAAIGANAARGSASRDVRRCEKVDSGDPDYWDVSYKYRGVEHHVQMSAPPGRTIYVNDRGEPRQ